MARIVGVEIPDNKKVWIGLTYIFGVGKTLSYKILDDARILYDKRVKDLTRDEVSKIAKAIADNNIKIEGDLRREIQENIRRLKDIRCYRGIRHSLGLPVRGQRTRANARTRKGPKKHKILTRKKAKTTESK